MRLFWLLCTVVLVVVSGLIMPGVVGSAQKKITRTSSGAQRNPHRKQKTIAVKEEADQSATRGIVASDVPDFKADTSAFALVIGISSYKNLRSQDQLRFADADAQALHNFLVSDMGGFRPENVTLLLNEQATREEILRELGRLQSISGPSSLVLVFFAGHGVVNKTGQAFLIASDTRADDLFASGIDMVSVNTTVQSMRARSVVIISDACHAASITNTLNSGSLTNLSASSFAEPSQRGDSSSFIFSAASPSQPSHEDPSLRHGLFTHFVLKGLGGESDSDADGVVTSQELYEYVHKALAAESQKRNITQMPEYNVAYDRSIPLAITKEEGRARYQQWFKDDSWVTRLVASFDEALNRNRLTKPVGDSAWYFYEKLKNYGGTPLPLVDRKRDELLKKIVSEADQLLEQLPTDPGRWNESSTSLEKAYEITHDNNLQAKQFFCTMMFYAQSGELGRAKSKCDAALELIESRKTGDPLLSVRIGQFYASLKDWGQAHRAYRLAMDTSSNETWLTEYADILVQLNIFDEAETQLRRALRTNPKYQPALIKLSAILLRDPTKERVAEAYAHITHGRQLSPDDLDTEEVFGRVLMALGETPRAIDSLLKVARLRPTGERRDEALLYLSQSFWRNGDLDRAISALREAEVSGSQNVKIFDALAALSDERGDVQEAIADAQRAVALTRGKPENAQRMYLLGDYLERNGQLVEAANKYREAERLFMDTKRRSRLVSHAQVLLLRSGLNQEAGVPRRAQLQGKKLQGQSSPIIVPGGLEALSRLTGIAMSDVDQTSLARVFDACLRNPTLRSRLLQFYNDYPEFSNKLAGGTLSGILELPPPDQVPSSNAREALKFFGVNDKKGVRQIKPKEFESRRYLLEALGGDSAKLKESEPVRINFRDEELPIIDGMETWLPLLKDGIKIRTEEQLLAFLKDPQAMKLYVGFSLIPEDAAKQFRMMIVNRANYAVVSDGLYFAAPYLRFDQQGNLEIPGQRKGEANWKHVLKIQSTLMLLQALFEKDNGGALYLFCALSSAGEVGDFIARSNSFVQVYQMLNQSALPSARNPFDFIDLLRQLRMENDQIRVSRVVEFWRASNYPSDPVMGIFSTMGRLTAGREILLVKQIALLSFIERDRPEWAKDRDIVELITKQTAANRESHLEIALDLEMTKKQLTDYLTLVDKIESLPSSTFKMSSITTFQATLELLRRVARNSSLTPERISELSDRFLQLDPTRIDYGLLVASFLKADLLRANAGVTGNEVGAQLIELLATEPSINMPARGNQATRAQANTRVEALEYQPSRVAQEQVLRFLANQKCTKLAAVFEALRALDDLEKNPTSIESFTKAKESVGTFHEPETELNPKKKSARKAAVQEPTLKEALAGQSLPMGQSTMASIRNKLAPFVGEALLCQVYALAAAPVQEHVPSESDLVRRHDLGSPRWSATQVDANGRITGNLVRLSQALAQLSSGATLSGTQRSSFVEVTLNSLQLTRRSLATRDSEEFVARTIDLGEDVLALYSLDSQSTVEAFKQLDRFMTQRRAMAVKSLVERAEIGTAIRFMTLSELYALGKVYLDHRLATTSLVDLAAEPGALGALARVILRSQAAPRSEISVRLRREINQFGMTTTSRNGLSRLELIEPEPYEYAVGFQNEYRLAERMQDLKLALTRKAHRLGGGASFPLSPMLGEQALRNALHRTRQAAGGTSIPERDWLSLTLAIQTPNANDFGLMVDQIANSNSVRPVVRSKWNDPRPANETTAPQQ